MRGRRAAWLTAKLVLLGASVALAAAPEGKPKTVKGPEDPDDPHGNDVNLYTRETTIGGLPARVRLRHVDADTARAGMDAVLQEFGRVHRKFSTGSKTSEIAAINHIADREEVTVSTETEALVATAMRLCRITVGGFDPTHHSFSYLWDLGRKPFVPPLPDEVAARLAMTGCDKVAQKPGREVRITVPGVTMSVGELLAGHALHRAGQLLEKRGIPAFVLQLGDDRYVMGRNKTRYWYTPVFHPLQRDEEILQLYVGSHAIATRRVTDSSVLHRGKRYHDVLDPATGRPSEGVLQATVVAPDPVLADAMSRALLALGPKRGLAMLAKVEQQVAAIVIDAQGVVHASAKMRDFAPKLPARLALNAD